jgi:tetratricopeptide (TPR) repeat protein
MDASQQALAAAATLYAFTSSGLASLVDPDERHVLSAELSYLVWRCCRRLGMWAEARSWESKCEQHVIGQPDAREYLILSVKDRLRTLPRLLGDRAISLTLLRKLRQEINQDPDQTLALAISAYRWVTDSWTAVDIEDPSFFAGESAWLVGNAFRLAGRYAESEPWFHAAAQWFSKTENPTPLIARVELSRASAFYNRQDPKESRSRLPRLLQIFAEYGMEDEVHRCRLLEGMVLMDLGCGKEAIASLSLLVSRSEAGMDPIVRGLAFAKLGEALANVGSLEDASRCFAAAIPLIDDARVPWALADCRAMLGEILRDQGNLAEAVPLYKSAVDMNLAAGLVARTAYLRVVLAETLIMAGRDEEAIDEIFAALPIITKEALLPTARAAVALLQESLSRRKADPEAVHSLRIELQRMREASHS